jgi:hypothetical protein
MTSSLFFITSAFSNPFELRFPDGLPKLHLYSLHNSTLLWACPPYMIETASPTSHLTTSSPSTTGLLSLPFYTSDLLNGVAPTDNPQPYNAAIDANPPHRCVPVVLPRLHHHLFLYLPLSKNPTLR